MSKLRAADKCLIAGSGPAPPPQAVAPQAVAPSKESQPVPEEVLLHVAFLHCLPDSTYQFAVGISEVVCWTLLRLVMTLLVAAAVDFEGSIGLRAESEASGGTSRRSSRGACVQPRSSK